MPSGRGIAASSFDYKLLGGVPALSGSSFPHLTSSGCSSSIASSQETRLAGSADSMGAERGLWMSLGDCPAGMFGKPGVEGWGHDGTWLHCAIWKLRLCWNMILSIKNVQYLPEKGLAVGNSSKKEGVWHVVQMWPQNSR